MKLHMGAGARIMPGWENLDIEPQPGGKYWDARQPLGYPDGSVEAIYSEHFIEHITRDEATRLTRECHRVLAPGGVLRISTPNLQELVEAYLMKNLKRYESVGFVATSPARLLNEGARSWGHLFLYDAFEVFQLFAQAGFKNTASRMMVGKSLYPVFAGIEGRPDCNDLVVEVEKERPGVFL